MKLLGAVLGNDGVTTWELDECARVGAQNRRCQPARSFSPEVAAVVSLYHPSERGDVVLPFAGGFGSTAQRVVPSYELSKPSTAICTRLQAGVYQLIPQSGFKGGPPRHAAGGAHAMPQLVLSISSFFHCRRSTASAPTVAFAVRHMGSYLGSCTYSPALPKESPLLRAAWHERVSVC